MASSESPRGDSGLILSSHPGDEEEGSMAAAAAAAMLLPKSREEAEEEEVFEGISGASPSSAVFNLINSIVGAGIMAFPATQKKLGLVLGTAIILLVGALTDASVEILIRFSRACKASSYGSLMAHSFGLPGRTLLQLCVVVNNLGYLIVYMIIIGDVLSGTATHGSAHHTGVFEEWAGGSFWWNGRIFILFLTTVLVVAPLVSLRRVDSLRFSSAVSVGLAVLFVVITVAITITKLVQGSIDVPRTLPDVHDQLSFWKLFTAVPVIVTGYICHQNVHPIANELHDATSIVKLSRISISICMAVYVTIAVFGYLLFGQATMDDVLSNFDADLGIPFGRVLAAVVRVGYALHLMLVFPLIHFSLRINLDSLLFPNHTTRLAEDTRRFVFITVLLVVLIFLGATLVPSIWTAFQFTGATTGVAVAFIFPGIIALRNRNKIATMNDKLLAWIMVVLAVISSVSAITTNLYSLWNQNQKPKGVHLQNYGTQFAQSMWL